MADIHGFLARVTLVLVLGTAAWSVGLVATHRSVRPQLVGGLIWVVVLLMATGLVGLITALGNGPPADILHVVYGVLALAVLPGAWAIARGRADPRRTSLVLAVALVVLAILVVRLFQTAGN